LGWHVGVRKHTIKELVLNVLDRDGLWPDGEDGEESEVPTAREEIDCVVGLAFNLSLEIIE
jgi:hypothetical protein